MTTEADNATDPAPGSQPPEKEPQSAVEDQPGADGAREAKPEPRPNALVRVFEWFTLRRAMREARAAAFDLSTRSRELHRRARLAKELADRALEPTPPFVNGTGYALACAQYAQAVFWLLSALDSERHPLRQASQGHLASQAADDSSGAMAQAWEHADQALLLRLVRDAEELRALKKALVRSQVFHELAELSEEEQSALARRLQQFSKELFNAVETPQKHVDRVLFRRARRVGFLALAIVLGIFAVFFAEDWLERRRDIAIGKHWRQSSVFQAACRSPQQSCPESPHFFFVTRDDASPWFEIDLGQPMTFSGVSVVNRTDGYPDRAVPLAVKVSNDRKTWREVARRTETFSTWKAEFAPTQARYVRFRALRRTWLHFARVRILR